MSLVPVIPDYDTVLSEFPTLPADKMLQLNQLVRRQMEAEAALEKVESLARRVKAALAEVQERLLPDLLDEIGVAEFTTSDGTKVLLNTTVRASLGRAKDPEKAGRAIEWLERNGSPHLVSHVISLPLTSGQEELVTRIKQGLAELNLALQEQNEAWSIDIEDVKDVNASRLSAWVRKSLEEGKAIPEDLFNVHRARETKIKT